MNGLLLTPLAPRDSLSLLSRSRGRLARQPLLNAPFKTLAPGQLQTSTRNVLEPPPNVLTPTSRAPASKTRVAARALFNSSIPPRKAQRCQHRSTPSSANFIPVEPFYNTVPISPIVLKEDFYLKKEASLTFPLEVNNSIIRKAIERFQVNIKNTVNYIDHVCCCHSRFFDFWELESIFDNNAVLMAIFKTNIFHYCNLDVYGCWSGSFNLCHDCSTCVSGGRKPKFGIFTTMPYLCCQY